ncbi:MAG: hypothetical protein ACRD3B_02930 [Candidatus Sulfotelmatobacter sp.]
MFESDFLTSSTVSKNHYQELIRDAAAIVSGSCPLNLAREKHLLNYLNWSPAELPSLATPASTIVNA